MIRMLAWCGTYTSTSSTVFPHSARIASAELTITRVANLNTSRPFIVRTRGAAVRRAAIRSPGSSSSLPPAPSAPSSKPRKPPRSTGSSTTAPAPSPKRTSVERSVQSSTRESMSPPTTSARCDEPRGEHAVGLRDRVHEPGAAGREVVGGRVRHPELVREERRRGGKRHVRRDRGDDDQVDAARPRRPPSRGPCGRRAARGPTSPRCRRRCGARGSRCGRGSTRRSCRRSSRARRS